MLLNNNHVRGIFKYSEDVFFEKDDFVVDGNCIYICKGSGNEDGTVHGVKPSLDTEHNYYSEYPGDKIVSASEYYEYVESKDRGDQSEDKYVSAHTLCEILENMYFGFGDNGILYDHVLYNPNTGIEYSIRGVHEVLDYSTPDVLDKILRSNDLNNGLIRISRNLPEIRDLLMDNSVSESNIVILKQYTYLDSDNFIPYRVQELMDPEKNCLYFRFSKGERLEDGDTDFSNAIVSAWKNLYGDDESAIEKLNSLEDYWRARVAEEEEKVTRMNGKFCYREVDKTITNHLGEGIVYIRPGETRDIKSIEEFDEPCMLDILIKVPSGSNVYRNYSIVIDAKDTYDSITKSETYLLSDDISLTSIFSMSDNIQTITLSVSSGVIKSIYYRDYNLEHIHDWILQYPLIADPTCTQPGIGNYICECGCQEERSIPPLGHSLSHKSEKNPTCVESGWWEYWYCSRCEKYFEDSQATEEYSGWDTGNNQVFRSALGYSGHVFGGYRVTVQPTCNHTGTKVRTCTICGYQEEESIPALGHSLQHILREPETCGDFGTEEHWHCIRCDGDFSDSHGITQVSQSDLLIYPTGAHNLDNRDSIHSTIEVIEESTYTDYPNALNPNPTHGRGLKTCSNCGNKIEVSLPFKQHVFSGQTSSFEANYINGLHLPSYISGYCPTCHEQRINYNWNENVPISKQTSNHVLFLHDIGSDSHITYTPATCNEYGYWTGDCLFCGAIGVRQYNWNDPPTGHQINEEDRESWVPNTCTTDAEWIGRCSVCHADHVSAVDLEHLEIGHKDEDQNDICDFCNSSLTS